jgi:hypothetical protein
VRARLRLSGHHQADKLAAREQALDDLVYRNHHLALLFILLFYHQLENSEFVLFLWALVQISPLRI